MFINRYIIFFVCIESICIHIHIYIRSHRYLEHGIGKLAIFGIPIIELENGYLEYS